MNLVRDINEMTKYKYENLLRISNGNCAIKRIFIENEIETWLITTESWESFVEIKVKQINFGLVSGETFKILYFGTGRNLIRDNIQYKKGKAKEA